MMSYRVFFGNLGPELNDEFLRGLCSVHGKVMDLYRGPNRRYAIVSFAHLGSAESAIRGLNGSSRGYGRLEVKWAKKRVDGGAGAGGGGDGAYSKSMASLEDRTSGFLSLLKDKGIGGSSKYLTEAQRIKSDPRYNLLSTDIERYQVFVKYVGERADEERKEKKERKDAFKALCEEKNVTAKTSWREFSREVAEDKRFKAIEKSQDRESLFNEIQSEIRKKIQKEFVNLIKEGKSIDRHSRWEDIKKKIYKDERYLAVDSSSLREYWFYDYVQDLSRTRGRSRSRGRKRSRSQSGGRDGKRVKESQGNNLIPPVISRDPTDKRGFDFQQADTWMAKQEAFLINQVIHLIFYFPQPHLLIISSSGPRGLP